MKLGLPADHGLSDIVTNSQELLPQVEGQPFLTDIQFEALQAGVSRGENVLVSAPTSTGKTLIGWWTIAAAVAAGGRAVYLVSHRALAKQKFEEAQRLFLRGPLAGDSAAIVCATGDAVEDASGRRTNAPMAAKILVATYEKFLGCLSVGGPPRDLSDISFVCDEVQLVGDPHRGQNVELLLTLMRRSGWRQLVGLSAVMSEKDAESFASWLQLKLVRNPTREKALRIECRAPDNVHSIAVAPGAIGILQTERKRSERETNRIVGELLRTQGAGPVIVFCMKVDDTYNLCADWHRGKPQTVTLSLPPSVELGESLRNALGSRCAFHNAELSEGERLFVEQQITAGHVDVVYATTTLAAGVNFPLGSAVFASWKRWNFDRKRHETIGRSEFQNMAGRVGRMGQSATSGLVIMSADGAAAAVEAQQLMNLESQEDLGTGITPQDFGTLTLQLFAGKLCSSRQDAFEIIASTLSALREQSRNRAGIVHWQDELNRQIDRLVRTGCLIESMSGVTVTAFGISVARSGMKPETALFFIEHMARSAIDLSGLLPGPDGSGAEDDLLFVLAHAAISSPEFNLAGGKATRSVSWRVSQPNLVANAYARRLASRLWDQPWMGNVAAANGALLIAEWAAGQSRRNVEASVPGVRLGNIETLARDVSWILTGISEIISDITSPTLADEGKPVALRGNTPAVEATRRLARSLRRQAARVAYGLPSDILWMTHLELPGTQRRLARQQMLSLRFQGLAQPHDLMDGSPVADGKRRLALAGELDPTLANQVRDAARRWKASERVYYQRIHARRATKVNCEPIISALYLKKGTELEVAFADAMNLVSIAYQPLDGAGKQAHPDFLITIDSYPSIVVEIKSKASDTDLVALNSATEVLAASELIGLRENFCLTVCSPGVEPSVPSLVESCRRLCVVNISDLSEAILRLKEGTLTREGFYNWLTTPGVAVMEDLPHPT
ncbi:DEAD/DEAH box helicase [Bradyrhizobium sp. Arg62]|uniref:DEAD/DEAH box helicase n=1 Tax=Bradyrhizobium brasilense TaxID=1419277 RepID=UPI001E3B754C|nr:DEAD/DEAH box helicase [Bradyrhizobium brasilense]MCC8949206.1 DEAD/DEAH box helicase [Bradyrhizobium brasilense]